MKTRTKFTVCAIVAIMLYTVAALVLTAYDKAIPDSLTVAYFSAWTVELGLLFGIRIKDKVLAFLNEHGYAVDTDEVDLAIPLVYFSHTTEGRHFYQNLSI